MAVRIGISLIAWQNDDLPELTKDYTTEGAMQDAAKIGYSGVERGRRMPGDTEGYVPIWTAMGCPSVAAGARGL